MVGSLRNLVTENPVVFVGFDNVLKFTQKTTEWWWLGLELTNIYLVATIEIL